MHRIFSGNDWPLFPGIRSPGPDHRRSRLLVQERPVPVILCILCIDVQWLVLLDGSAPSPTPAMPNTALRRLASVDPATGTGRPGLPSAPCGQVDRALREPLALNSESLTPFVALRSCHGWPQRLGGPWSSFVCLRGFLFLWLFQATRPPPQPVAAVTRLSSRNRGKTLRQHCRKRSTSRWVVAR